MFHCVEPSEGSNPGSPGLASPNDGAPIHGLSLVDPGCAEDPSYLVMHSVCLLQGDGLTVYHVRQSLHGFMAKSLSLTYEVPSSLGLYVIPTMLVIAANHSPRPRVCLEGNSERCLPLARFPPSATALLCHAWLSVGFWLCEQATKPGLSHPDESNPSSFSPSTFRQFIR